jgi:hypothetical protein
LFAEWSGYSGRGGWRIGLLAYMWSVLGCVCFVISLKWLGSY